MNASIKALRWILRIAFLLALAIGVALWTGHGFTLLRFHMWLGFLAAFDLLALVVYGFLSRINPALPIIALLWAIALPVIGIAQMKIMLGPNHWVIEVVHLILGLGAIGLGEALSKRALLHQRMP